MPGFQIMFSPRTIQLKDGSTALVRRAEQGDAEALLAHLNEVGAEEVYIGPERVTRSPEEERKRLESYDGTRGLSLVAFRDGRLVAAIDFIRGKFEKNAHVGEIAISIQRRARRLGLGEALLLQGIEWSRHVGIRKLALVVFASNEPAIALYRKVGFEVEGRLRGHVVLRNVPTDVLCMGKWLEPHD